MSSYIISVAEGSGNYRHIRISSGATLMDLHKAILAAYELEKGSRPSFQPQRQAKGGQPIKYATNNTRTTASMQDVKLEDTGFAAKGLLTYTLYEPRFTLNCRTLQVLDEETQEPLVIRAAGSSLYFRLSLKRIIRNLEDEVQLLSTQAALETAASLPAETKRTLADYFLAASNLHGLVPLETIYRFYNSKHPSLDLLAFTMFGIMLSHLNETRLYILDKQGKVLGKGKHERSRAEYIAEYSVVDGKAFSYVLTRQEGKPYYLPQEEEFLRYAKEDYTEENQYFLDLRSYLLTLGASAEKTSDCMQDILTGIRFYEATPQAFFDILKQHKIRMKDIKAANHALDLFTQLSNNTRTHLNCGHTPKEISALLQVKSGRKMMGSIVPLSPPGSLLGDSELREDDVDLSARDTSPVQFPRKVEKKPGRNAPCPCGSGKKYKHCCGRFDSDRGI